MIHWFNTKTAANKAAIRLFKLGHIVVMTREMSTRVSNRYIYSVEVIS